MTYDVTTWVERGWWIIDIPAIRRRSRSATLAEVSPTARAILADALELSPDSVDVNVHAFLAARGTDVRDRWQGTRPLRPSTRRPEHVEDRTPMAHPPTHVHPRALEKHRRAAGLTVTEVLTAAEMSTRYFSSRLHTQTFSLDDIARLAAALDTTPRALATTTTVVLAAEGLDAPRSGRVR